MPSTSPSARHPSAHFLIFLRPVSPLWEYDVRPATGRAQRALSGLSVLAATQPCSYEHACTVLPLHRKPRPLCFDAPPAFHRRAALPALRPRKHASLPSPLPSRLLPSPLNLLPSPSLASPSSPLPASLVSPPPRTPPARPFLSRRHREPSHCLFACTAAAPLLSRHPFRPGPARRIPSTPSAAALGQQARPPRRTYKHRPSCLSVAPADFSPRETAKSDRPSPTDWCLQYSRRRAIPRG